MSNDRRESIERFIREKDVRSLRIECRSRHGLMDNKLRLCAWPILLNVKENEKDDKCDEQSLLLCSSRSQVEMDAIRTLARFSKDEKDERRSEIIDQLVQLVCTVLVKNPELNYYQGYHDICLTLQLLSCQVDPSSVFMLKFDILQMLESITDGYLRDFMEPTMEKTINTLDHLIPLIDAINSSLAEHVYKSGVSVIFALSWLITWFGHVIDDIDLIARLYDLFLASHKLTPLYVAATLVAHESELILSEENADMPTLHKLLSKLPSTLNQNAFDEIIEDACSLIELHPPHELKQLRIEWKRKWCVHPVTHICYSRPPARQKFSESLKTVEDENFEQINRAMDGMDKRKPKLEFLRKLAMLAVTFGLGAAATIIMYNHVQKNPDIGLNDFLALIYGWQ